MAKREKSDASTDTPTAEDKTAARPGEDDVARKFREALERKQAKVREGHGEDHKASRGVGPATNDHHRREFRRKSGG